MISKKKKTARGEGDGRLADIQNVFNGVGDEFLYIWPGDGIDYI